MKNSKTSRVVYSALFAALILVATQFIRIPMPFGYFNFGDCFIILSALIIGGPYAVAASAIGSVLADFFSGYTIYAPATLVIKSLMVIAVIPISNLGRNKGKALKIFFRVIGATLAEAVMVLGYFIYDAILYNLSGAIATLPWNILQGAAAVITSVCIIALLEHSGLLERIKIK